MKPRHRALGHAAAVCLLTMRIQAQAQAPARPPSEQITTPGAQQPQGRPQRPETPESQSTEGARTQTERRARPIEEKSSVTHHSASIGGQQIAYTATAANYIIRADDGTPKANDFLRSLYEGQRSGCL